MNDVTLSFQWTTHFHLSLEILGTSNELRETVFELCLLTVTVKMILTPRARIRPLSITVYHDPGDKVG